jgi:hypothetical protein
MTDEIVESPPEKVEKVEKASRAPREKRAPRKATSTAELSELQNWLDSLEIGVKPSVKVNGSYHPTAILVVDLGQPVKQIRLTSEQTNELGQRLRRTAREILGREASIRVSVDNNHGIHWASVT